MDKMKELREQAASLALYNTRDNIEELIYQAQKDDITYIEFINKVFSKEIKSYSFIYPIFAHI